MADKFLVVRSLTSDQKAHILRICGRVIGISSVISSLMLFHLSFKTLLLAPLTAKSCAILTLQLLRSVGVLSIGWLYLTHRLPGYLSLFHLRWAPLRYQVLGYLPYIYVCLKFLGTL